MPEQANSGAVTAAPDAAPAIPVRAKSIGWLGNTRVREGAEFTVPNEDALGLWMERLDGGPSKAELNAKKKKATDAADEREVRAAVVAVKAAQRAR